MATAGDVTEPISVTCRHGTYPGVRSGGVASYEFEIPPEHEVEDPPRRTQRVFLLLDEHIQLHQPLTFLGPYAGWWYVDLVDLAWSGDGSLTVVDHWIDVVVPPFGQPYQLLDLDEFGEALASGALTAEQAAIGLARFQHFVDTHLRGELTPDAPITWADFPPEAIAPLRSPDAPRPASD